MVCDILRDLGLSANNLQFIFQVASVWFVEFQAIYASAAANREFIGFWIRCILVL
jgi:hypothetical protein